MATLRFSVAETEAGSRLDRALAGRPEIETRSLAERLVTDGAVTVDGAVRPKSHRLEAGSVVEVELPAAARGLQAEPVTVRVAYEDEHLVVVDKPAGMTVHAGAGTSTGTLAAQLLGLGAAGGDDPDRPGIVHRLDRDTSGLLVVARSEAAFAALQEAIRRREVERRYLALVRGRPRSRTGRIDAAIGRDRRDPTRRSLDTDEPREAVTWFEVVGDASRARAPRRSARDRPDAPDPRPPRSDRPSGRGRRDLRREGRPRPGPAVPARAPAALRASGHRRPTSTSSRRCRTTSRRPSSALVRPPGS